MNLVTIKATAAGSAGSATATAYSETFVKGWLEAVLYTYSGAPNTTTIALSEDDGPARTLLSVGAGNTNGVSYVRAAAVNTSNAAITGSWARIYLPGFRLKVVVAASDPAAVITVKLIVSNIPQE